MNTFIERIIAWNEARFTQEVKQDMTVRLILEEFAEYSGAKAPIDRIDACADMIYLAVGAMWREGMDADQITRIVEAVCTANETKSVKEQNPDHKYSSFKTAAFVAPEVAIEGIYNERT